MGRIRYPWSRRTSAPAAAGGLGFLFGGLAGAATNSVVVFVIVFILSAIVVYIVVRKIEEGTRKAVDKAFGKYEDKLYDKIMGNSDTTSSPTSLQSDAHAREKTVAGTNEWKCVCGKVNQNYTGQCICGVRKSDAARRIAENKRKALEIAQKKKKQPQLDKNDGVSSSDLPVGEKTANEKEWKCICGKINPNYVGTCKCGMRKSEAIRRRAEGLKKTREILAARKAKEQVSE
ncbi:MAG: hypothetical protein IK020_09855 [Clostridiales bacterium]|nr:hypothetical protein [Clostridiales bacterium]